MLLPFTVTTEAAPFDGITNQALLPAVQTERAVPVGEVDQYESVVLQFPLPPWLPVEPNVSQYWLAALETGAIVTRNGSCAQAFVSQRLARVRPLTCDDKSSDWNRRSERF